MLACEAILDGEIVHLDAAAGRGSTTCCAGIHRGTSSPLICGGSAIAVELRAKSVAALPYDQTPLVSGLSGVAAATTQEAM